MVLQFHLSTSVLAGTRFPS